MPRRIWERASGARWGAAAGAVAVVMVVGLVRDAGAQVPAAAATSESADAAAVAAALKRGAAAAAKKDFEGCVKGYEEAVRLAPDAMTFGELGLCEEALGRVVPAFDHVFRAMEKRPPPVAGGNRGAWVKLDEALNRLLERVGRVLLNVFPGDAEVLLDGVVLGTRYDGRFVTILPGEHTWTFRREGFETTTITATTRAGDMPNIPVMMLPRVVAEIPPCGVTCQDAIRDAGKREAAAEMAPTVARLVREEVRREMEVIYRWPVDPSLSLFAGGLLSLGLTLDAGPGFVIGGDARWRAYNQVGFSVGLEARALLPTKILEFDTGYPVDLTQVTGALVPCLRYTLLAGCALVDGGVIVDGSRGPLNGNKVQPSLGLGPRLMADIPFADRFGIRAFADLRFQTLLGGGYIVDGKTWDEPVVTGYLGLALSFGQPVRTEP